jgi:hypothetical protein
MDTYELEVMRYLTENGKKYVAVIPQYAIPPNEQWSIDFVGIDLVNRELLYVEVTSAQTPSPRLIDKIKRNNEWTNIIRKNLQEKTKGIINSEWKDKIVVFVIDNKVNYLSKKLNGCSDIEIKPLSVCFPEWLRVSN